MNFGSEYVLEYDNSEEEAVSDEEFREGMSRALSSDRYVYSVAHLAIFVRQAFGRIHRGSRRCSWLIEALAQSIFQCVANSKSTLVYLSCKC